MILSTTQLDKLHGIFTDGTLNSYETVSAIVDAYEKMRPSDSDGWISVKERLPTAVDAYGDCEQVLWYGIPSSPERIVTGPFRAPIGSTHWKPIRPPVITPPTLEEVERPKFEEWMKENYRGFILESSFVKAGWSAWLERAKQSAKA